MKKALLKFAAATIALSAANAHAQEADVIEAADKVADAVEGAEAAAEVAMQAEVPLVKATSLKTEDADPALWVVKDEDTTIYMFGTVHFLKPGLTWFDEAVKEAFDASETIVLEIKPGDPGQDQQTFAKHAIDQSGKSARSQLSEDEQKSYVKVMERLGTPVNSFDPFKPWAAALIIQITGLQQVGFDPEKGVEKILESAAMASGKEIVGLETADFQFGIFDSFSAENQKAFLVQTIDSFDEIEKGLDDLVEPWAQGNTEKLAALLNEGLSLPEFKDKLLTRRNANWAEWINKRMEKPGTVFMAVGAGHLAGTTDVQTLLSAYGLNAERINY